MHQPSRARIAGIAGMAGGLIWILSVIMQNSLDLGPDTSLLRVVQSVLSLASMSGMIVGFLGLIWGGAFRGRFGTLAVLTHVLGYALIVTGGLLALLLGEADSPLFLLFPIGGALHGVAAMLLIIAVLAGALWAGWQRWMPLLYGVWYTLAVGVPLVLGVTPDGPGMSVEIGMGAWWFVVALAVYTAQAKTAVAPAGTAARQV